jgi:hypothetical protein
MNDQGQTSLPRRNRLLALAAASILLAGAAVATIPVTPATAGSSTAVSAAASPLSVKVPPHKAPPRKAGHPVLTFRPSLVLSSMMARPHAVVTADARRSTVPKGDRLTTAVFTFGDHTKAVTVRGAGRASHRYARAGRYTVTLTLRDVHGRKATSSKVVTVGAQSVVAAVKPATAVVAGPDIVSVQPSATGAPSSVVLARGVPTPTIGGVLVAPASGGDPTGLLSFVTAKSVGADGRTTLGLRPARIPDAYSSFAVHASGTFAGATLQSGSSVGHAVALAHSAAGGVHIPGVDIDCHTGNGAGQRFSADLDLSALTWQLDFTPLDRSIRFLVSGHATFTLDEGFAAAASCSLKTVAHLNVPVPGTPLVVTVTPVLKISVSGAFALRVTYTPHITYGFERGELNTDTNLFRIPPPVAEVHGNASAEVFLGIGAELSLAGAVGVELDFGPALDATFDSSPTQACFNLAVAMKVAGSANADLFIKKWSFALFSGELAKISLLPQCGPPVEPPTTAPPTPAPPPTTEGPPGPPTPPVVTGPPTLAPAITDPAPGDQHVSCPASGHCLAVDGAGWYTVETGGSWSGPLPVAAGSGRALAAVSCASVTNCVTVDSAGTSYRYDGATWTPVGSTGLAVVASLSCPQTAFCVVAGGDLTSRWDGSSWTPTAQFSDTSRTFRELALSSVSCASATWCVAVGAQQGAGTINAAVWDGQSWAPAEVGAGASPPTLSHVTCPSSAFCMADGAGGFFTWNGGSWAVSTSADPTLTYGMLSCMSASACLVASGGDASSWNGSTWSAPAAVGVSTFGQFTDVSCADPTSCTMVDSTGAQVTVSPAAVRPALTSGAIEPVGVLTAVSCVSSHFCFALDAAGFTFRWDGTAWQPPVDAVPGLAGSNVASSAARSISCTSTTFCMVLAQAAAATWNGTGWQPVPMAGGHQGTDWLEVSCTSAAFCLGVGFGYAAVWNGAVWSFTAAPSALLRDVSCPSPTHCVAVSKGATQTFNGATWSAPHTLETGDAVLLKVSCPTVSDCTVVSYYTDNVYTLHDDTWSTAAQSAVPPAAYGVSCPVFGYCVARSVDGDLAYFDGTTWHATGGPGRAQDIGESDAISCTAEQFCAVTARTT